MEKIQETTAKVQETTLKAILLAKNRSGEASAEAQKLAVATKANTITLLKNPHFQTVTISSGTGAVVLGAVGGAFGTACGVIVGTTAGAVPALFTFGLSLPFGAVVGGALGGSAATVAGGTAGALVGGAAGECSFRYRFQIKDGLISAHATATSSVEKVSLTIKDTTTGVKTRVHAVGSFALAKASAAKTTAEGQLTKVTARAAAISTAAAASTRDPRLRVTAGSAVGGAVVCAPAGGVTGGVAGMMAGGAVGLVPAIFTFGLSIPVCAAIGGGMGLCAGTIAGGSAGALSGGSIGYGSYTYRKEIKDSAQSAQKKIEDTVQATQKKIGEASQATKKKIGETSGIVRAKAEAIVNGGTGGA